MIRARVLPSGTVRLRATDPADRRLLESLPYVRCRGRLAVVWWTHLPDLRRDLGSRLRFAPGSGLALRGVLASLDSARRGDDAEVLSWFRPEARPRPYQVEAIHFALARERALIADQVGTGKTADAIGAVLGALSRGLAARAVVVCPAAIRVQWWEEFHKFAARPPSPIVVAVGPAGRRRALYRSPWRVLILSPETLRNDARELGPILRSVDFAVWDEASAPGGLKNAESKTARVGKAILRTRFRLALTATPIENGLADLRSIFEWVDPRVFPSRAYFDRRYVVWATKRFRVRTRRGRSFTASVVVPARYRHLDEVRAKVRPAYLRRTVEDVGIQLPRVVSKHELVELGVRQRAVYEAIREQTLARVRGLRGGALLAPLAFLRQACDSTALVTQGTRGRPAHAKVDRLRDLLDEAGGERVLVFTEYARMAALLVRELSRFRPVAFTGEQGRRERQAAVAAFVAGDRRVLVMTRAGERGLNLQVASLVVQFDLPWNPASIKQRIGRARRIGSEHSVVRVVSLVARDTVEDRLILGRLLAKRSVFEGVFGDDELSEADPISRLASSDLRGLL